MRNSKRTDILDAALRVIDRSGVTGVTFESVAEEAALTKGGLLYHFPTRDALLLAIHEHLAGMWEDAMVEVAGGASSSKTEQERLAAYAHVATQTASRAELLLMLEASNDPVLTRPWQDVIDRWTPPEPEADVLSEPEIDRVMARLAADGLWVSEALSSTRLSPRARAQVAEAISARLIGITVLEGSTNE